MIHFVHRKDTWVRVHNNCLKIKTPTSVHLAACVCVCVCVFFFLVSLDFHSPLREQQHPKCE